MQQTLFNLGAEVLSTTPEMVTDETQQFIYVAALLFMWVLCIGVLLCKRVSSNLILGLPVLLIFIGLVIALISALFAPPQKSSGKTIFEIQINDQTNMQGIFEQFEVVDTSNYPIFIVKSK